MSFFEPPPPPPEPPEQPPQPPWIGPPGNELGVAVPLRYVVVRTDDVAILLDGFVAYSTGVELELTVKTRRRRRAAREFHRMAEDVHFGFRFADGHKVTNLGRGMRTEERSGPVLMQRGGHGGDGELSMRYWLWPLPPPGPLQAVVEWTAGAVAETEVEVDGAAIREAAARVDVLWPEDAEPAGGGWVGYTSHTTRSVEGGERDR